VESFAVQADTPGPGTLRGLEGVAESGEHSWCETHCPFGTCISVCESQCTEPMCCPSAQYSCLYTECPWDWSCAPDSCPRMG
jgi:hypothetical protein